MTIRERIHGISSLTNDKMIALWGAIAHVSGLPIHAAVKETRTEINELLDEARVDAAREALLIAKERLQVTEGYWAQKHADSPESFTLIGSYAQARTSVGLIDQLLTEIGSGNPDPSAEPRASAGRSA